VFARYFKRRRGIANARDLPFLPMVIFGLVAWICKGGDLRRTEQQTVWWHQTRPSPSRRSLCLHHQPRLRHALLVAWRIAFLPFSSACCRIAPALRGVLCHAATSTNDDKHQSCTTAFLPRLPYARSLNFWLPWRLAATIPHSSARATSPYRRTSRDSAFPGCRYAILCYRRLTAAVYIQPTPSQNSLRLQS